MSGAIVRAVIIAPLLLVMWNAVACEARPVFPFDLFSVFDPTAFGNSTHQLQEFFLNHGQHSLSSLAELFNLGQNLFLGNAGK